MKKETEKTIGIFIEYYEEIFSELKDELNNIVAEYKDLNEGVSNTLIPILQSVNDCKTAIDFKAKLNLIKDNSFQILTKKSENYSAEEKVKFLRFIHIKTENLYEALTFPQNSRVDIRFTDYKLKDENGIVKDYFLDKETEISKKVNRNLFTKSLKEFVHVVDAFIKLILSELKEKINTAETSIIPEYKSDITWEGKDTELLELITALVKNKKLKFKTKDISRKDAIIFFSSLLNHPIKNPDSLLSHATGRKTFQAPFLESLKQAFIDYCREKDEKDLPKNQ